MNFEKRRYLTGKLQQAHLWYVNYRVTYSIKSIEKIELLRSYDSHIVKDMLEWCKKSYNTNPEEGFSKVNLVYLAKMFYAFNQDYLETILDDSLQKIEATDDDLDRREDEKVRYFFSDMINLDRWLDTALAKDEDKIGSDYDELIEKMFLWIENPGKGSDILNLVYLAKVFNILKQCHLFIQEDEQLSPTKRVSL